MGYKPVFPYSQLEKLIIKGGKHKQIGQRFLIGSPPPPPPPMDGGL